MNEENNDTQSKKQQTTEMKTQTSCGPDRTAYESPSVREVEMRVHGVLCGSLDPMTVDEETDMDN